MANGNGQRVINEWTREEIKDLKTDVKDIKDILINGSNKISENKTSITWIKRSISAVITGLLFLAAWIWSLK